MPVTGRTPMSRAEAARHAALVRWKKKAPLAPASGGMSNPKIRARVAEILAAKQKGPKAKAPKGKGKPKAAKPKGDGRTPQEKANQNRAAVAKQGGMDKLEGTVVRLGVGMNSDLEKDAHEELIKKGLAERGADGKPKLSAAGKKWKAAADKGDVEGANAALAEGKGKASEREAKEKAKGEKVAAREKAKAERTAASEAKKQERAKAVAERKKAAEKKQRKMAKARKKKKADDDDAPSGKEAVAAAMDRWARVREIQKLARKPQAAPAAAPPPPASNRPTAPTRKAIDVEYPITDISDHTTDLTFSIKAGARHSRTDIQHLQTIHDSAVACGANCGAGEDDDEMAEKAIKSIMDNPQWYAQHECGDIATACGALQTLCMLIQSELAEEDEDTAHVDQLVDAARLLVKFVSSELDELEGAAGDAATVGHEPMKAIDIDAFAVKSLNDDEVVGPAIRYGSASEPDMSRERDYFTPATNFYLDAWDKRPMIWHHALPQTDLLIGLKEAGADESEIKAMKEAIDYLDVHPMIGMWTKAVQDPATVWMSGVLDKAHRYRAAIKRMIDLGMLKISTDSIPQLVRREKQPNGTHEVKAWPIVAASLTPTAAEPRLLDVQAMKSYYEAAGITLPFAIDDSPEAVNPDSVEADGRKADESERARRLLLEIELLQLETR